MRHHARVAEPDDDRCERILDAAFAKFSAYGFARTSMADIAEGAGMSRPALYQYYANKEDIFGATFERVLTTAATRAIAKLDGPGDLAAQLDGFLQRWFGDLVEQLHGTQHGDELMQAKAAHARPVAEAVDARLRKALTDRIARELSAPRTRTDVVDLVDLTMLAGLGCKQDAPPVARFRRRLTALARALAAQHGDGLTYAASKTALARYVRRNAPTAVAGKHGRVVAREDLIGAEQFVEEVRQLPQAEPCGEPGVARKPPVRLDQQRQRRRAGEDGGMPLGLGAGGAGSRHAAQPDDGDPDPGDQPGRKQGRDQRSVDPVKGDHCPALSDACASEKPPRGLSSDNDPA